MEEEIETWESRASSSGTQLRLVVLGEQASKETLSKAQAEATTLTFHAFQTSSSLSLTSARILTLESEQTTLASTITSFFPIAIHALPKASSDSLHSVAGKDITEEPSSKRQEEASLRGTLETKERNLALHLKQLTEFRQRTEKVASATKALDSALLGVGNDIASLAPK